MSSNFLVVDDDKTFCDVLARSLTRQGYHAVTSYTIKQALSQAKSHKLNYAVVDLKIGSDSGLHLIPELLKIHPKLEIIVLTGYSSIATAVDAVKLGAKDYLCKPSDTKDILAALRKESVEIEPELNQPTLSVDRLEWEHIQQVLKKNDGNISATARELGMHRRTLQRKLQKRPVKK